MSFLSKLKKKKKERRAGGGLIWNEALNGKKVADCQKRAHNLHFLELQQSVGL